MSNQTSEHTLGMEPQKGAGNPESTNAPANTAATNKAADPHSYLGRSPPAAPTAKHTQGDDPDLDDQAANGNQAGKLP
jgi:hypothetical protein